MRESAQTQIGTGKLYWMKYRILTKARFDGSICYVVLSRINWAWHLHFGNVHGSRKVEISLPNNVLADSIQVISQEKLDFRHIT
jgi:hypothetical protein